MAAPGVDHPLGSHVPPNNRPRNQSGNVLVPNDIHTFANLVSASCKPYQPTMKNCGSQIFPPAIRQVKMSSLTMLHSINPMIVLDFSVKNLHQCNFMQSIQLLIYKNLAAKSLFGQIMLI
jgi:hypothetical protein